MADLEQVQGKVSITSDTSGASQARSALESFGSSLQRVGEIALGVSLANIGEQLGSLARETVAFSIDAASQTQQARITMDAFTGSTQKGLEAMKIMNTFARAAPLIPLGDVQQMTTQLLGFGFGLDQLKGKLQEAGELSIAAHVAPSVAVDLLARAKEGIFNLREFGQFGISRDELSKFGVEFTKTGSVVNKGDLLPALEKLANTKFGTIFQKEAGTFGGAMQNVKDDFKRLASLLVGVDENGNVIKGGFFESLQNAALSLYGWLDGHMPQIEGFFTNFWNVLKGIGSFLKAVFTPVWEHIEQVYEKHKDTINTLGKLLVDVLLVGFVAIVEIVAVAIDLGAALIDNILGQYDAIVKFLDPAITSLYNGWQEFLQFFVYMGGAIKQTAIDIANDVISMINTVINAINGLLRNPILTAGVKLFTGVSLPSQIATIAPLSGGTPASNGVGISSSKGSIGGFTPISITNNNTFNTPYDPTNFSRQLGQQISNAQH